MVTLLKDWKNPVNTDTKGTRRVSRKTSRAYILSYTKIKADMFTATKPSETATSANYKETLCSFITFSD